MNEQRIPVIEERARIEKEIVERAVVKVDTFITEHDETISEALMHEEIEIRHVAVNAPVDAMPAVKQDGDIVIIPIVEERIVVSKRLFLKEELHVHRRTVSKNATIPVKLRSTEVAVHRERSPQGEHVIPPDTDSESL